MDSQDGQKKTLKVCHNTYMVVVTFVYLVFETCTLGNKSKYYHAFHVTFLLEDRKMAKNWAPNVQID